VINLPLIECRPTLSSTLLLFPTGKALITGGLAETLRLLLLRECFLPNFPKVESRFDSIFGEVRLRTKLVPLISVSTKELVTNSANLSIPNPGSKRTDLDPLLLSNEIGVFGTASSAQNEVSGGRKQPFYPTRPDSSFSPTHFLQKQLNSRFTQNLVNFANLRSIYSKVV
jgi:hypothetical protein